ncbi:MAG: N-acetyltransferase [Acidaminococcus sp.]|jgi:predicted N-acetyltransferase YhbS|nr:N-acetyltransferase [Acidaminococcus sp.]MCI2100276.1 N-acetyltransferase [Acidaminococcus sp.]MCI2114596.1 N-acetyltransferase [Acidaminococcus sp.]MCI2116573.1 N-acetyltransferase [Acidaminococcus sp.]
MTKNDLLIRRETPEDYHQTEMLVREAFWNVYHPGCNEHYILHCYRSKKDFIPELDLVLEKDGQLIGQIMYVHSEIKTDKGVMIPIVTFGPLSIHPNFSRRGYGKYLLDNSIKKAAALGAGAIAITGNPLFYGKSGFVAGKSRGIRYASDPEAEYFLIKELKPDFLRDVKGTFMDPEGYLEPFRHPEAFERYDAQFPKKEKLVLPGQLGN